MWARYILVFAVLLFVLGCQKNTAIISGVSESDANEILVALSHFKIKAFKKINNNKKSLTFSVFVSSKDFNESLKMLVANQLPKTNSQSIKEIFSVASSGIIPTKTEESARLALAMQGEAENLIKAIPGIIDAKVVFSISPIENFSSTPHKKRASVVVITKFDESPIEVLEIKNLVASSITDLEPQDITVIVKAYSAPLYIESDFLERRFYPIEDVKNKFPWLLLWITFMSLIIGAYGIFYSRRQLKRNVSK